MGTARPLCEDWWKESTLLWNETIRAAVGQLVDTWRERRSGFGILGGDDEGVDIISHFVWADNVYILGKSLAELQQMVGEMIEAIGKVGFYWKKGRLWISSLRSPRTGRG